MCTYKREGCAFAACQTRRGSGAPLWNSSAGSVGVSLPRGGAQARPGGKGAVKAAPRKGRQTRFTPGRGLKLKSGAGLLFPPPRPRDSSPPSPPSPAGAKVSLGAALRILWGATSTAPALLAGNKKRLLWTPKEVRRPQCCPPETAGGLATCLLDASFSLSPAPPLPAPSNFHLDASTARGSSLQWGRGGGAPIEKRSEA